MTLPTGGTRLLGFVGAFALFAGSATAQTPLRRVEFADAVREALQKNPTIGQAALTVATG